MTPRSDRSTKKSRLFASLILATFPVGCTAFDWGDFHVFAVVFFSFLGGFIGLSAIFGAIYVACLKPFLNRFQEEVAETHREHHPWPPGSVRWRLQQIMKTERSRSAADETKFPAQRFSASYADPRGGASGTYYPAFFAPPPLHRSYDYYAAQLAAVGGGGGEASLRGALYATDRDPIIGSQYRSDYAVHVQEQQRPRPPYERPTYFTPTPEKSLGPLREEIEEYRIIREESFVSSKSGGGGQSLPPPEVPPRLHRGGPNNNDVQMIRTTTTTTTSSTRRRSPNRHALIARDSTEIGGPTSVYAGSEGSAEPKAVRVGIAPDGAMPPQPPPTTHPPSNI